MPLPETVRVKLSSEAAGAISLTPVVVRDIPIRELVEFMLGVTGKDATRVHDILRRGALVSGASRFRWAGWDADPAGIEAVLSTFPDPDPSRRFQQDACVRSVLRGSALTIEITREAGSRRRFLRRRRYWDVLMELAVSAEARYLDYSYRDRADCFRVDLSASDGARLRDSTSLLAYSSLAQQIRAAPLEAMDLYVARPD